MKFPSFKFEQQKILEGYDFVAGCDEVGVGPLAGPVVAAVCILDRESIKGYRSKSKWYYRVRDSKTISEQEREELVSEIKKHCLAYGIAEVEPSIIDEINIHNASMQAMKMAVHNMFKNFNRNQKKIYLFLDGRFAIKELNLDGIDQQAVIDGDAKVLSISAASIIAKVHRDSLLKELDQKYPLYGFAKHKGYNTKAHQLAIAKHGILPIHRRSFIKI